MIGGKLPAWALALCAGLVLALIVAMTTKSEKRPRGHSVRTFKCCSGRYFWRRLHVKKNHIFKVV